MTHASSHDALLRQEPCARNNQELSKFSMESECKIRHTKFLLSLHRIVVVLSGWMPAATDLQVASQAGQPSA